MQVSNNHLVIDSEKIEKKINQLSVGDQIKIKGKLVNVHAENLGKPGKYDPKLFEWNSSTKREDTGGGACETIYIEDIEIIKKGNAISYYLNKISWFFFDNRRNIRYL